MHHSSHRCQAHSRPAALTPDRSHSTTPAAHPRTLASTIEVRDKQKEFHSLPAHLLRGKPCACVFEVPFLPFKQSARPACSVSLLLTDFSHCSSYRFLHSLTYISMFLCMPSRLLQAQPPVCAPFKWSGSPCVLRVTAAYFLSSSCVKQHRQHNNGR